MNFLDLIKRNAQGIVDKGKGFMSGPTDPLNPPAGPMSKPFDINNIPTAGMTRPKKQYDFIPDTTLSNPTVVPGPYGIQMKGEFFAKAAQRDRQRLQKIKDFLPDFITKPAEQIQRGLYGDKRLMIGGDGQGVYDGGFGQFFRPLGESSLELKSHKAHQALQNLVQEGKITQSMVDEISMDYLTPLSKKKGYSSQVKKELSSLRWEDRIDRSLGGLDFVSLGTVKPVAMVTARKIAGSESIDYISKILRKDLPEVDEKAIKLFSTILKEFKNADDVKTVLDNIKIQSRQFKPPTAPKADTAPRTLPTVAKEVSNTNDVPSIIKTLTNKTNLTPATATRIAPELAQATDAKQVLAMIRGANVEGNTIMQREFLQDIVDSSPFSQKGISNKLKHLVNREGQFLEQADLVRGSRTSKIFHDVKSETGFLHKHDSEFIEAVEKYWKHKKQIKEIDAAVRATPKVESTVLPANKETKALQAVSEQTPVKDPQVPFKKGTIKPEGEVTVRMYATGKKVQTPLAPDARIRAFVNQSAFDNFIKTVEPTTLGHPNKTSALMKRNNIDIAKIGNEYVSFNPKALQPDLDILPGPGLTPRKITPTDFESPVPFRDTGGLQDGLSLNQRDASLSVDNRDVFDIAKYGFGPNTKAYLNLDDGTASFLEKFDNVERALAGVLKGTSKAERQQVSHFRLGIDNTPLNPKLADVNKKITQITDPIREEYNAWARSVGLPEIGYIENYLTKKPEFKGPIPTKTKKVSDSFTKERVGGDLPEIQETDLIKILSSYARNVYKKMYIEEPLNQLLVAARETGKPKYYARVEKHVEQRLNATESSGILSRIGETYVSARSTMALGGNLPWTLLVQPQSLSLTVGRNPSPTAVINGFKNAWGPEHTKKLKKMSIFRTKTEVPMSRAGLGDIGDHSKVRIGSKREKANSIIGKPGDIVERELSRISSSVGYQYGKSLGMAEDVAQDYGNLMIGLTQSEYLKHTRAGALEPLVIRVISAFQTFAFEVYRLGKTLVGAPGGGLPIKKKIERTKIFLTTLAAMQAGDWLQSKVTGRKLTSFATAIPIVGPLADDAYNFIKEQITGKESRARTGRSPISGVQTFKDLSKAYTSFVEHDNIQPLRKFLTKWGMGYMGIGGAASVNNIVDAIIANAKGYQTTGSGEVAFPVEGPRETLKAAFSGVYTTKAGQEYIESGFKKSGAAQRIQLQKDLEADIMSGKYKTNEEIIKARDSKLRSIREVEKIERMYMNTNEYEQALSKALERGDLTNNQATSEIKEYKEFNKYNRNAWGKISAYTKAFQVDPGLAMKALLTDEELGAVEDYKVTLKRFKGIYYQAPGGSEEYMAVRLKELNIPQRDRSKYNLEHVMPVAAGGDNSDSNLVVVDRQLHNYYTQFDVLAIKAIEENRLSRKAVEKLMIQFKKDHTITAEELMRELRK